MPIRLAVEVLDYTVVLAVAFLARVALSVLEFEFITPGQRTVWSWPVFFLLAWALATGAFLARRANLPSPRESLRSRVTLGLSVGAGAAVGLLTIGSDWISPAAAARGLPTLHVSGVAALPFYLYGAILLTVVFHFLPTAVTAWLVERLPGSSGRWVLAAGVLLVAFSEDLGYFLRTPSLLTWESGRHVLSVAANATEALLIYRFGLLAGLLQRGTTYFLWHLVWPNLH